MASNSSDQQLLDWINEMLAVSSPSDPRFAWKRAVLHEIPLSLLEPIARKSRDARLAADDRAYCNPAPFPRGRDWDHHDRSNKRGRFG